MDLYPVIRFIKLMVILTWGYHYRNILTLMPISQFRVFPWTTGISIYMKYRPVCFHSIFTLKAYHFTC